MSNVLRVVGQVAGVVNGALSILRPSGEQIEIDISPESGHVVVATADQAEADLLANILRALRPGGNKRFLIQAAFPSLDGRWITAFLTAANGLVESQKDDGRTDAAEGMKILMAAAQEAL